MLIYIYRQSLCRSVPESGESGVGGSGAEENLGSLMGFTGVAQGYAPRSVPEARSTSFDCQKQRLVENSPSEG